MTLAALVLSPLVAAAAAFLSLGDRGRRGLLVGAAVVHLGLVAACWAAPPSPAWNGYLALDPLGLLFLSITSLLFAAVAVFTVGYLARESHGARADFEEGHLFS